MKIYNLKFKIRSRGFSLIEMVFAIFIASIMMGAVINLYGAMTRSVKAAREQTIIRSLTSNYLEIVRNLPYSDIGTEVGNPTGSLADEANPIEVTIEGIMYQIYYEVTYIDDAADGTIVLGTDVAANDYKQIKMFIRNTATSVTRSFLTTVSPKGLEGLGSGGALVVEVFDATGLPVPNASVHIENLSLTPDIILNRTTDANGMWVEVGLPASVNGYHIVVTKTGYSSDQTYPLTPQNPNPIKPDWTIVAGEVTQVSMQIDRVSNLTLRTLNSTCQPISNVEVNLSGAKLIGTSPNVFKYNQDLTSSGGQILLTDIEWDAYLPVLLTEQNLMTLGTSPIQQVSVLPASSATYTMILGTQTPNSLLVIVKDYASGLALEGATVTLHRADPAEDFEKITGGSVWFQDDWSAGSGQSDFTNPAQYFSDDGNVDVVNQPGVRLSQIAGEYALAGQFISSTFDTGAVSNFTTISWEPTSQSPGTSIKFQIASNSDNATWNFVGPDGTSATFYTVSGNNIATAHDGDRYVRYKAILETTDEALTPVLSSVGINYVSGCFTPGQVSFGSLTADNDYTLEVSLPGYLTTNIGPLNINGNQSLEVLLSP